MGEEAMVVAMGGGAMGLALPAMEGTAVGGKAAAAIGGAPPMGVEASLASLGQASTGRRGGQATRVTSATCLGARVPERSVLTRAERNKRWRTVSDFSLEN